MSKLSISDDPFDKPPCRGCSSYLTEPYIKCAECGPSPFLLCLQVSLWQMYTNIAKALVYSQTTQSDWNQIYFQCFTRGFEYKKHESDHRYEIMVSKAIFFYAIVSNTKSHRLTHSLCILLLLYTENRRQTSLCWSLGGRHRRRWLCWRQSWTVALETGECFQRWFVANTCSLYLLVRWAQK